MGDTLGYARALEGLLEEYDREPARLKLMASDAGRFVRDTYWPEMEKQSVAERWRKIVEERGGSDVELAAASGRSFSSRA